MSCHRANVRAVRRPAASKFSPGTGWLLTRYAGGFDTHADNLNSDLVEITRGNVDGLQRLSPDGRLALSEHTRVLHPGGRLIIFDVNYVRWQAHRHRARRTLEAHGDLIRDMHAVLAEFDLGALDREIGGSAASTCASRSRPRQLRRNSRPKRGPPDTNRSRATRSVTPPEMGAKSSSGDAATRSELWRPPEVGRKSLAGPDGSAPSRRGESTESMRCLAVRSTVTDSNIFRQGSTWEPRATANGSGSRVELVAVRHVKGPKGAVIGALIRLGIAKRIVAGHLRHFLSQVEERPRSDAG